MTVEALVCLLDISGSMVGLGTSCMVRLLLYKKRIPVFDLSCNNGMKNFVRFVL